MLEQQQHRIGWLGATSFGLAGTANFFTLGPVLNAVGNIGIVLFIVGMLIALLSGYGWLKLVLQNPANVGGAAVNSFPYFKSRSPLLLTLLCFANWSSWVAQVAFSAIFCASAIIQWLTLSQFSATFLATIIILGFIGIGLTKITIAARLIVPAAITAVYLGILSAVLPILFGNVHINLNETLTIKLPFSGWFGYLTAIMSGFYLVGWIVPAYEVTTWLTGEMKQPKKNLPRAFIMTGLISSLTFMVLPIIWLSTLGYSQLVMDYTTGTNWLFFSNLFPGFGPTFSSMCGFFFIVSYMLCSGIGSLIGPSRMLVQLAEYGLFPRIYQKRLTNGAPWVAVSTTGILAIVIVWAGVPLWLIAATNFGYLASMILASFCAWLISNEHVWKAEQKIVTAGAFVSITWIFSILFGFQQYGIIAIVGGISFILLGAIPYITRQISELHQQGRSINLNSIHVTLPLIFFVVMILNSSGYLLMLLNFSQSTGALVTLLHDIFITVIILTLTIGLWITDSVAHAVVNIANASHQLSQVTMTKLVQAMKELGAGALDHIQLILPKKTGLISHRKDELGIMINNFSDLENQVENVFLSAIAAKDQLRESRKKILKMNAELEQRVIERTNELEKTQKQLLISARQAGMADVATSTLHNVGNILNSVKVTLTIVEESSSNPDFDNIVKVSEILKQNLSNLSQFLITDPKGQILPNYLIDLIDSTHTEHKKIKDEILGLKGYINHIEDIVNMQKSISGVSGMITKVFLPDVIENAIKLCSSSLENRNIEIQNEFNEQIFIKTDETKLVQILVNLIKNAQDALSTPENCIAHKTILIKINKIFDSNVNIEITDNGIGIPAENLNKIFSLGFTTKQTGHGFGLHNSAIAAKEMGGSLKAFSNGFGQGATFILELPLTEQKPVNRKLTHDATS